MSANERRRLPDGLLWGAFLILVVGAIALVLSGPHLVNMLRERRKPDLREIERHSGLHFPTDTVLVDSHLDFFLRTGQWDATLTVSRPGFADVLSQLSREVREDRYGRVELTRFDHRQLRAAANPASSIAVNQFYVNPTNGAHIALEGKGHGDTATIVLRGRE